MTACATCHWNAGADGRISNTLGLPNDNPHKIKLRNPVSKLAEWEFPFVRVDDPNTADDVVSPNAKVVENREEVVGSKGVERRTFVRIVNGQAVELGNPVADPDFSTRGVNLRTVTSRNSPSGSTPSSIIVITGMEARASFSTASTAQASSILTLESSRQASSTTMPARLSRQTVWNASVR